MNNLTGAELAALYGEWDTSRNSVVTVHTDDYELLAQLNSREDTMKKMSIGSIISRQEREAIQNLRAEALLSAQKAKEEKIAREHKPVLNMARYMRVDSIRVQDEQGGVLGMGQPLRGVQWRQDLYEGMVKAMRSGDFFARDSAWGKELIITVPQGLKK